ncbi:immune inhibitor A domain-containing protein [Brevibacillus choshinensis]|uniref:immune inhibitor A domain-containing protein n=1 Tax=Brevibacillus choshinensis TaxID=54911 RepID=UPI002E2055A5|nr:immune inhibitor A domain-containing protein [Brevibacillus choshinensis]MED4781667.1 immune inhibitor A [Brevibacillus choshinensis]
MKKGKKLLSILFSSSLVLSGIAAVPATGMAKSKDKPPLEVDLSTVNMDRLVKALIDQGEIDEDADQEEINDAVEKFLRDKKVPHGIDDSSSFGKKANKSQISAVSKAASKVSKLKEDSQVRASKRVHTDNLVIALVEFSDLEHNHVPKQSDSLWTADFNQKHYKEMLFDPKGYETPEGISMTTMAKYYYEQSGNTWMVDGVVTPWQTAEKDKKYYGGNDKNGNDGNPRDLVIETLESVGDAIKGHEDEYDQRDPYDLDGDGDLMEPDGMLDNLMLVHSGIGEETGEDADAIWSHRWTLKKPTEIPGTDLVAYDYMIQPEDGAPGVFAHEYGHNLGLPDLYDTSRLGHDSPVGAWSLMSSGSHTGKIFQTQPTGFDPWSKMMLQQMYGGKWIEPEVISYENLKKRKKTASLVDGSSIDESGKVIKLNMPQVEKKPPVQPKDGDYSYFSDEGDNLNTKMTSEEIDLTGVSSASMSFDSWRAIETGYDYLYVNVIDTATGESTKVKEYDDETKGWDKEEISLNDFAGKKIKVEFNYVTDGGLAMSGFYLDNFEVTADGEVVFSDDAEGDKKFELDGFLHFDGEGKMYDAYYLVELRSHEGVDAGLEYFRRNDTFFTYDPGLVIWYYDGRYGKTQDNNTSSHPGYGMLGVVDSHQEVRYWNNDKGNEKAIADSRYQVNDAAFSPNKTSGMNLDYLLGTMNYKPLSGITVFKDSDDYSMPEVPEIGKILPEIGLQIKLTRVSKKFTNAQVEFSIKK